MYFRIEWAVKGIDLPKGHDQNYQKTDQPAINLQLYQPAEGREPNLAKGDWLGVVETEEAVSDRLRTKFAAPGTATPGVAAVFTRVFVLTHDFLSRVCGILRWRRGASNPTPTIVLHRVSWSDDNQKWSIVRHSGHLSIDFGIPIIQDLSTDLVDSIRQIVRDGISEPLGHELFNEAWQLRTLIPEVRL